MDGFPLLFAHVFSDGSIEEGTPGGITQDNVRRVDEQVEREVDTDFDGVPDRVVTTTEIKYCFSGLLPVFGGNVTIDAGAVSPIFFPYPSEGRLSLNTCTGKDGDKRTGLSVSAWRVEVLGRIGKSRKHAEEFDDALTF